ncbi:MAG: hypothetical protein WD873_03445 [Candidatus Hydrogenedentales bacterium]
MGFLQPHPGRKLLLDYAERLVDGTPLMPAATRHVARCGRCRHEINAMARSLRFSSKAGDIEPSRDLTARILLAAKSQQRHREVRRHRVALYSVRFAAAAMVLIVTAFLVQRDVATPAPAAAAPVENASFMTNPMISAVTVAAPSAEEELLERAVLAAPYWQPKNAREKAQLRAIQAMESDISEALAMYRRNPGLARAAEVVNTNRQRQSEALKELFVERTL